MARRNLMGLLLVVVTGALLIWAFEAAAEQEAADAKLYEQFNRFIEIVRLVQKQYVRDVDTKKMFEHAINGMLGGLDPFSNYIPESELAEFNKGTRGKFFKPGARPNLPVYTEVNDRTGSLRRAGGHSRHLETKRWTRNNSKA